MPRTQGPPAILSFKFPESKEAARHIVHAKDTGSMDEAERKAVQEARDQDASVGPQVFVFRAGLDALMKVSSVATQFHAFRNDFSNNIRQYPSGRVGRPVMPGSTAVQHISETFKTFVPSWALEPTKEEVIKHAAPNVLEQACCIMLPDGVSFFGMDKERHCVHREWLGFSFLPAK